MLLQIIQKGHNQRGVDLLEVQMRRRLVQPLLNELQEMTEGVAIGADSVRTRLALLHQALSEEPLQQWSKVGTGGHGLSSPTAFETMHRLSHQLRGAAQIPLRIGNVDMTEVGGQDWQTALRILTGPIPLHEGICCESVSHIVETRSMAVGRATQADLSGQRIESPMDLATIQTIAPAGDEQIGRHRPLCPMAIASGDVVCEHFAGRGMHRDQASLAELGAADPQHCCLKIDILKL